MNILIDMDNTIAEFDEWFLHEWRRIYPDEMFIPLDRRTTFHPHKDYPEHLHKKIHKLCHSKGFIRMLPVVPGAISAINEMIFLGHDVRFCTSHLFEYKHSVLEKFQWIEEYFGPEGIDRIILTRDKTMIRGDILIDDKPIIHGSMTPSWEHILYDRPFNREVKDKKRLTWQNWKDVLILT